ncbi:MAG: CehA/McbA family metallohydrolase [Chloroflexi bacterium]|nr:CehA/McbA family metallohydrolase [Chloroflexota bacterium]
MNGYEPSDIALLCNAGPEALGVDVEVETGSQTLRGLPFQIGGRGGGKCFIVLDGSAESVTVPIGGKARRVVFAHALLETSVHEGGPLGVAVAEYVFRLSGGREERVPVRERFEIAAGPIPGAIPGVPGRPFRAMTDRQHELLPRHEGPWGNVGRRQTEVEQEAAKLYHLWAWENPEPETAIESIEIVPAGPRFLVAGITLGHLDENPFARQRRRPVKVTLEGEAADKPFNLEVEVDRGVATYPFALPEASADEFLAGSSKGWGETQNDKASPSYVEIAATPSATVTVKQDGEKIADTRWGEIEEKGVVEAAGARFELMDRGRNWVHVTVLDDETGKPVPCRVHFRSPEGVPYQPHGHHNQVNSNLDSWHIDVGGDVRLGQITYAYIDGTSQGWLPRGDVIVDVARGFEYEPIRTKVRIEPGQRELTLRLKRWVNMNQRRWFSGDSHVHFLSAQGSHIESQGEDLNVVNLLQSQWGSLFTNTEEFTGAPSISRVGNNIVYVSQENRQHFLGHMILWGLKQPVMPWCSDGPSEGEIGGAMETTLSHWADEAHGQGGYVISPHFPNPNGEPATLVATGRLDAVEMIRSTEYNHNEYYRYLNCGYKLPLVGGTDKMSSDVPVGLYRTYVNIPDDQEFSYDNWCRNVVKGRTFLSGGPIIGFSVEGKQIGDTVDLSGPGTVEVEAWAEGTLPVHRLEIVQDGRVVASTEESGGARKLTLKASVKVNGHSWLAARCGGPGYYDMVPYHDLWRRGRFAHTSPIYIAVGGEWTMFDEAVARDMLTLIEGSLVYIGESAPLDAPGTATHHHGEDNHLAYLQRPFLEARNAVHKRMDALGIPH